MGNNYSHLVDIDESERKLIVHRVFADGRKELFTQVDLPVAPGNTGDKSLEKFCRILGENLLLDSPAARRLLQL
jgi:hypothetical protein